MKIKPRLRLHLHHIYVFFFSLLIPTAMVFAQFDLDAPNETGGLLDFVIRPVAEFVSAAGYAIVAAAAAGIFLIILGLASMVSRKKENSRKDPDMTADYWTIGLGVILLVLTVFIDRATTTVTNDTDAGQDSLQQLEEFQFN